MPWTASSSTLVQIAPGKPYTSAGAERAPWRARTRAAIASSSAVVTPGRTRRATSRSVADTARPARRSPSRSSGVSTDMAATLTPVAGAAIAASARRAPASGRGGVALGVGPAQAADAEPDAALRRAERDVGVAGDLLGGEAGPVGEDDGLALAVRQRPER